MSLDAQQVNDLQNAQPATDWSKFDQKLAPTDFGRGMFQGDDKLHVRFFTLARIDVAASTEHNRPIFKDVPYVEIMMPGDKNNIVVEPVWDQHMRRFPTQWEQFKRGEEQQAVGTPLKIAPFLTPALIAELNLMKIVTIEQLANLSDNALTFMGAQEFKQAAKRYLDLTGGNEALLKRIAVLEAQVGKAPAKEEEAPVAVTAEADDLDEMPRKAPSAEARAKVFKS
jgi:hypothetical protein